jgi:GAF domain-containing protein
MTDQRERAIIRAFVELSNELVDGYDVVDLLSGLTSNCAKLLDISSAGLLLADAHGVLHVIAASSERTRNLAVYQLQREQGPCLDCFRSGSPVLVPDLATEAHRWPLFARAAASVGVASVHAVPMRLHDSVLGTLGLFGDHVGPLDDDDLALAQALAHVASVAIVNDQSAADSAAINTQLQQALSSRIVLEQAKGVLAYVGNLDMDEAFAVLRRYARDHGRKLSDIARLVVARELKGEVLLDHARSVSILP